MVNVHLARDFDIGAGKVWALLEDFGNISWAPGIDKTEVIGEGVGMITPSTHWRDGAYGRGVKGDG